MFYVFLHTMVYYGIILNTSKILSNYEKVSTPYILCPFFILCNSCGDKMEIVR